MKKDEQLRMIRKSVEAWNQLRLENRALYPDLCKLNLYKANLNKVNLKNAKMTEADLSRANLNGADLSEADLRGTDLREADLRGANLSGADLCEVDLTEANLKMVNLSHANLRTANLSGANCKEADLSAADMTECILDGVNFNQADLSGADVSGASFWGVANAGWKIDGIKASHVYFCRGQQNEKEKYRQNFKEGQFEALHRTLPTLELIFEKGLGLAELLALNALIEKISMQDPDLGMKVARITKNEFGTIVGVKVDRDEFLPDAGKLIKDAIDRFNRGISADILIPQLSPMLAADVVHTLENTLRAQPVNIVINMDQPTITLIKADGSSSPIS
ncbi:MAG: pentapeptide repeat-containing protein [Syntrophaceae bacterium]|nr:pentapeptide repeat-containing protein [Syntrophaceae bacterium]